MGRPKKADKRISVNRKLPPELWKRLQEHADSMTPRCTDTAVLEAAITEYLDRHAPKTKKGEKA